LHGSLLSLPRSRTMGTGRTAVGERFVPLGRRLLNICVSFSEDEVALGVRSTSADTLSDQPLSEWPAGREADRTSAQRTEAGGPTERGSLSDVSPTPDSLHSL